jgi:hypothetical protein
LGQNPKIGYQTDIEQPVALQQTVVR